VRQAINFFVVGPSGYIRVCNHSPINLNHVNDLDGLKQNDYWSLFLQKSYLPAACYDCEQRHDCDGGCREVAHIVGGTPDAPDILLKTVEQARLPVHVMATGGKKLEDRI